MIKVFIRVASITVEVKDEYDAKEQAKFEVDADDFEILDVEKA